MKYGKPNQFGVRRGYSLVELMIVTAIIGIVAGLVLVPAASRESAQLQSAGRRFTGMVEYAQHLAIARSDQTFLIKVDQAKDRFWLATRTAPDTPLAHPAASDPYLVQLGTGSPDGLTAVRITAMNLGGDGVVMFDSAGGIDQSDPAAIEFAVQDVYYIVALAPDSGAVEADYDTLDSWMQMKGLSMTGRDVRSQDAPGR
ncbi:MAG: prepilin-type N-terminal cleavage/methylation domain-containing protein [Phycisphaerae bacterium]